MSSFATNEVISARYIKITNNSPSNGYVIVPELEVYDFNDVNVALNKPTSSSSIMVSGNNVFYSEYMVDGNIGQEQSVNGSGPGKIFSHTQEWSSGDPEYLQVDLGTMINIKRIKVFHRADWNEYISEYYKLELLDEELNNVKIESLNYLDFVEYTYDQDPLFMNLKGETIKYDNKVALLEMIFANEVIDLSLENITVNNGTIISDLQKVGAKWTAKITFPNSDTDENVVYTINVNYNELNKSLVKSYNTYAPIIGGISALNIISNIPDTSTENSNSIILPNLANTTQLTNGTVQEQQAKRKEFIKQLLNNKKELLKSSNKKIVMSTNDLLGVNDTVKKNKLRILDNFNTDGGIDADIEFDTKTLSIDEGVYVPLENVGDSILFDTATNKLKIVKASETEYDIYEGYVDENTVKTKTLNETDTSSYDKFSYVLGSVGGQFQTFESLTMEDIISPNTTGTVTITFNQSVSEPNLKTYLSLNPAYIGTIGDVTSNDGGLTFTGNITRSADMNKLNNVLTLNLNDILSDVSFNVLADPSALIIVDGNETLLRSLTSITMSDTSIKFPETGSTFEVKFTTNDVVLNDIQGNISLNPITSGTITNVQLSNEGFSLIGNYIAPVDTETSGNLLIYTEGSLSGNVEFVISTSEKSISNICFYGDAKVLTSDGYKLICELKKGMKIQNKEIEEVTVTVTEDKEIVLMKSGSLMKNMPLEDTRITKEHKVLYKGKMIEAKKLVNGTTIVYEKYNGDSLYNILLAEEGKMIVNGMIVETLSPTNNIARLYKILQGYNKEEQKSIIKIFNEERKIKKNKI